MVLNAECRKRTMFKTFNRIVVQIDVRNIDVVQVETIRIDRKTVILRCNFHLLPLDVENRMVSAVMSEFQLERAAAQREPHDLMAQTNSENRFLTEQSADIFDGVIERLRIAGPIR